MEKIEVWDVLNFKLKKFVLQKVQLASIEYFQWAYIFIGQRQMFTSLVFSGSFNPFFYI
jgi:hypothetical protein